MESSMNENSINNAEQNTLEQNNNENENENLKKNQNKYNPLLNKIVKPKTSSNDLVKLDKFLENEKTHNESEPWCKLNKTVKSKKLIEYVSVYQEENHLTEQECEHLVTFLKDCLDRKRLHRVKDVLYDKERGVVTGIPALCYLKSSKHFTLKNMDNKRVSTLKSLAPKNSTHGTMRKKELERIQDNSDEEDT
jgi:NADPH-dependent 7-cyano-7-deazaguanine reductase QueF